MALAAHALGQEREAIRQLQVALLECQPDDQDRERMRDMIGEWESRITDRRKLATTHNRHTNSAN